MNEPVGTFIPKDVTKLETEKFRVVISDSIIFKMMLGAIFDVSLPLVSAQQFVMPAFCGMRGKQASDMLLTLRRLAHLSL